MAITHTARTFFSLLIMLVSSSVLAKDIEHTIDLSFPIPNQPKEFSESGKLHLKVINMLPVRRYVIEIGEQVVSPPPFQDPRPQIENNQESMKTRGVLGRSTCDDFNNQIDNIMSLTDESLLPAELEELKRIDGRLKNENCGATYEEIVKLTEFNKSIDIQPNTRYTISVSNADTMYAKVELSPINTWLTHVGFTFVDNKDENYFSKKVTTSEPDSNSNYELSRASSRDDFDYAAMAMFTYPFYDFGKNWQLGFTAGLGTDSNNLIIGAGLSLIVYKNVVITAGVVGTEFDVLKGEYNLGDNLGESPIESDNLVDQTYKFAPALTISLRFNSGS